MKRYEDKHILVKRPYKLGYFFDNEKNQGSYYIEKGKYGNDGRWGADTYQEIMEIWYRLLPYQMKLNFEKPGEVQRTAM